MLDFSHEKVAPENLSTRGISKYDEFFEYVKKNMVSGEWMKINAQGSSREDLDRILHSISSTVRAWKTRMNKSGKYRIQITQSRQYESDTKGSLWIHFIEFSRFPESTQKK